MTPASVILQSSVSKCVQHIQVVPSLVSGLESFQNVRLIRLSRDATVWLMYKPSQVGFNPVYQSLCVNPGSTSVHTTGIMENE